MDATHLHLIINHVPILGSIFGFCLLAYGLFAKNQSLENAGMVTLIIVALMTIPTFLSGEESEDAVEKIPGISEYYLEEHEEMAEIGLWLMIATGIIALGTILVSRLKGKRLAGFKTLTLLFAAVTVGVMILVGNYGGKIRHSELRSGSDQNIEQQTLEDHDED